MTASQLIEKVGVENIGFQYLDQCLIEAKAKRQNGEITFGTPTANVVDLLKEKPGKVCMIVWMPRDRVEAALKEGQP